MVADVVEAIIGSACLSGDRDLALWVSKRLKVPLPKINHWHELRSQYTFPERRHAVQLSLQTIAGVEKITGFKFKRVDVLAEALVCSIKRDINTQLTRFVFTRHMVLGTQHQVTTD